MSTLTEFLLARIAEDEAIAQAALDCGFGGWEYFADRGVNYEARTHIARHHPARVLAECEAKRQIVEVASDLYDWDEMGSSTSDDGWEILTALALPYADHPDYDEAWRA